MSDRIKRDATEENPHMHCSCYTHSWLDLHSSWPEESEACQAERELHVSSSTGMSIGDVGC